MKKTVCVSACIVFMFVLFSGLIFAQEKPIQGKITQRILIKGPCQKLLKVENDESMPKNSLVQRYRVTCETKGQKQNFLIEVKTEKTGKITEAKLVGADRSMGRIEIALLPIGGKPDCELCCVTVCELGDNPHCYYVCVCCP